MVRAGEGRDHDVLEDREAREGLHDLERAREAAAADFKGLEAVDAFALEEDLPSRGRVVAVDDVEDGRLAGAVRADEPEDLPLLDRKGHVADGLEAAETFRDVLQLEEAHEAPCGAEARRRFHFAARSFHVPTIPFGKKMMRTMIRIPKKTRCPDFSHTRKISETRM